MGRAGQGLAEPGMNIAEGRIARALRAGAVACKDLLGLRCDVLLHVNWNLGDEIMALPLLQALREKYPGARLTVLARHPAVFFNNPYVGGVNPPRWGAWDRILDIRKEDRPMARLPYWERLLNVQVKDTQPMLYFTDEEKRRIARARDRRETVVAISSAAQWRARRWAPDAYRALAKQMKEAIPDLRFLEIGKDCPWMEIGENFIGKTDVREAALLLASSDLFIGSDSGLMHLAAAAGTPALALFGPVEPASLVGQNRLVFPVESPVDCRGCWTFRRMRLPDTCPLPSGRPICLDAIKPEVVAQKALHVLNKRQ